MGAPAYKIDETYGSFSNYLRDAVKLSDSDLATIRQRLLEPQFEFSFVSH